MKQEEFKQKAWDAAREYASRKKIASRPETQHVHGAMWAWDMLMAAHDAIYYEEVLRQDVIARLDKIEPWQESLITETAKMMAERDGIEAEIAQTGRLLTKMDKNMNTYKESNPLYVHLKELQRTIGMQREHLGLSFKVNPNRMKESPKKGDENKGPMADWMVGRKR